MLARGSLPFRLPVRSPATALGQIASPRPRVRLADGGSLLETAINAVTAPDPSGQSRIVNPFPGDYNQYGFGPEWNWFDYLNSAGNPPPGTTPPPPSAGGPGTTPPPSDVSARGNPSFQQEGNGFGGKGALGNGAQQAAADAAARNVAQNPSLKDALKMASSFAGPLGAFSLAAKTALSQFGIGQNPFNDPNVKSLSPEAIAAIAASTSSLPQNAPTVTVMNAIDDAIARQRALANAKTGGDYGNGFQGGFGSGSEGGTYGGSYGSSGFSGAAHTGGMGFGGGGGGGSYGGGGGDRGAGTQGSPGGSPGGGLGGGYRLAKGGKARMKGLGWLANGGRLHLAGGGSTNTTVLTSLLPIAAGLIGNIVSGPIGGAVASGAATAMTGGSLQDALVNTGPDAIDSFFKYFGPLFGLNDSSDQPQSANTNAGASIGSAGAADILKALTSRVPSTSDTAILGGSSTTLPYTKPGMAGGGELDARGGTHVQGEGDGQSDDIPAQLSDGEFVVDAATVSTLGNGSNKEGAARLEQMRKMIRQKAGYKNVHTIPPKQKSVSALLGSVTRGKAA